MLIPGVISAILHWPEFGSCGVKFFGVATGEARVETVKTRLRGYKPRDFRGGVFDLSATAHD